MRSNLKKKVGQKTGAIHWNILQSEWMDRSDSIEIEKLSNPCFGLYSRFKEIPENYVYIPTCRLLSFFFDKNWK